MTKSARYPDITDHTLRVILAADKGGLITPELIDRAAGSEYRDHVMADLASHHMIEEGHLTPLADTVARLWRQHFANVANNTTKTQQHNGGRP